ncbi:lipopolysaccharide transport periplasmic protein LptA [Rubrivivax albus]|uniref:Lipopolysaccharide export system protein LptA n=1 Tax=Rubrivivax albus TaxID=2499835 RepID=A0A437JY16_9BURK|nr:lipopolysaccharide transport periplasmic protein LptA [Rubrivivax albus]RVT52551.1 lipopolysaccharide transport periplasmic protein LptA [Rubrivivax albus]
MPRLSSCRPLLPHALLTALLLGGVTVVQAEKADRRQPIVVEADKPGVLDLQRQVIVFNGNVQIVQGTMIIRAERIEVREQAGGTRNAVATGAPGQPATYRQKRDGVDEVVEGSADRIEYDAAAGTLRFVGNGAVRRLRAGVVADEITGAEIRWDDAAQQFSVIGGDAASGGRVRAVLTPLPEAAASKPAAVPAAGGR